MKLSAWNPSHDDMMSMNSRILWSAGDIWKTDQNGIPHSFRNMYGDMFSVIVPAGIPLKYKNRKITRAIIWCNSCEMVTGIELHYGSPLAGGYAVQVNPVSLIISDVTNYYES